jgi:hypothetical protein
MEEIVKSQVGAALHLHGEAANPTEFRGYIWQKLHPFADLMDENSMSWKTE